jgi:hypothetical protein
MRRAVVVVLFLVSVSAWTAEFHVSPSGDDANPGTEAAPFQTLNAARDAARGVGEMVTVWVHDGIYRQETPLTLGADDSRSEAASLHFRAANPGKARIWGGRTLEPASFKPVKDDPRIPEAAREYTLRTDLAAAGIVELGNFPDQFRTPVTVPELFFNGLRMTLAQWPNTGWAEIESIVESGPASWRNHASDALGAFTYSGDYPSR